MIRALLSTGPGRLHLVQAAVALKQAGVAVRLITGWVPSPRLRRLANVAGRLARRPNLYERLDTRRAGGLLQATELHSCPTAEMLAALILRGGPAAWLGRRTRPDWLIFGRSSRAYLHDADIFHVRSGAGQGGAIALARRRGMKIIADHSISHPAFTERQLAADYARFNLPFHLGPDDPLWRLVLQDCADADLVLVNSDHVRDTFLAEGFPPERVAVAYWGVRPDFAGLKTDYASPGPLRLLFTGSFGVRKGAHVLLEALQRLDAAGLGYSLTVVGTHTEAGPLLAAFPVRGEVRLIGHLPQDALTDHLANSDVYVFPSLSEGCAMSCMEALAAGLPVVTTRETGVPVRDGHEALIVPAHDAAALAAALLRLANDGALRAALGRAAADLMAAHYTWDEYGRRVAALYERLLASPPGEGAN